MSDDRVTFVFLPEFGWPGDGAVLFIGNSRSLAEFADFLAAFPSSGPAEVSLEELPLFTPLHGTQVSLCLPDTPAGMRFLDSESRQFRWGVSAASCDLFADLVRVIANAEAPGHHYLDTGALDQATVIVSKGEYDPAKL